MRMTAFSFRQIGIDGFVLSLILTILLACLWPDLGKTSGLLNIQYFTDYGIAFVFLLYGLALSPQRLKEGVSNWRLHLIIQTITFIVFPVFVYSVIWLGGDRISPIMALGFFYLSALPSTVSSSVAMTSLAKGNVAGAIFNASISSLIGVFATPLWVNFYLHSQGAALDLSSIILKITLIVVLPIILGQILRPFLFILLQRHIAFTKMCDRITILAIVLNSFSDSIVGGVWLQHGLITLGGIGLLSILLFFIMYGLSSLISKAGNLNREDHIAAIFCGSKKSLAAGVPMAMLIFAGNPEIGLIIVPLMLYHLLQLVIVSIIARRYADQ